MKLKTYHIAGILLLSALLPVCLIASLARAQTLTLTKTKPDNSLPTLAASCKGGHADEWEFFTGGDLHSPDGVGTLPPVSVLEVLPNRINFAYVGRGGIKLYSLDTELNYTRYPDKEKFDSQHHGGCYSIYYCKKHLVALQIEVIEQKYCHTVKQ